MAEAVGVAEVGYLDCAGGGQVVVRDGFAYIGHVDSPAGTTIADVRDPSRPRIVAELTMAPGTHSHKVRVGADLMVTNRELNHSDPTPAPEFVGGLGIYDVSDPTRPREITRWETPGNGVHRFDFDGRYVYCSPTVDGYHGNIMMILDLADPARPQEVGRWWMPGQWTAGGEEPNWKGTAHRCHHPLRFGNRLYTSYWFGGFVILDIDDMAHPKYVGGLDWSPPFSCPTHSAVRVPFQLNGRDVAIVADEDVYRDTDGTVACMWVVDVTDEAHPVPFATFQVDGLEGTGHPKNSGCHQPVEQIRSSEVPFAWFAQGLRIVDIAQPRAPREVARYVPDVPSGSKRVCSNDVYVDDRGLIYLVDRRRGLNILERT